VDSEVEEEEEEEEEEEKEEDLKPVSPFQAAQDDNYVSAASPRGTPTPGHTGEEEISSEEEEDAWSASMKSHRRRMKLLGQSKAAGTISPEEYTKIVEAETQAMEMERELSLAAVKNAKTVDLEATEGSAGGGEEDRREGGKKSKKAQPGGKRKKKKRWRRRRKDMKKTDIISTVSSVRFLSVTTQEVNAKIRTDVEDLLF
jgi:hypothetical protein